MIYATVSDILCLKPLTESQQKTAEALLEQASAKLRLTAKKYGKNIDDLIADVDSGQDYALAVKSIIIQSVCRAIDALDNASASVTQGTESIGAYSLTATYLNAGQSLYFLKNELKLLGLLHQTYGALNLYDVG